MAGNCCRSQTEVLCSAGVLHVYYSGVSGNEWQCMCWLLIIVRCCCVYVVLLQGDACREHRKEGCSFYGDGTKVEGFGDTVYPATTLDGYKSTARAAGQCLYYGLAEAVTEAVASGDMVIVLVSHARLAEPESLRSLLAPAFRSRRRVVALIDEAHNLDDCAMDAGSVEVSAQMVSAGWLAVHWHVYILRCGLPHDHSSVGEVILLASRILTECSLCCGVVQVSVRYLASLQVDLAGMQQAADRVLTRLAVGSSEQVRWQQQSQSSGVLREFCSMLSTAAISWETGLCPDGAAGTASSSAQYGCRGRCKLCSDGNDMVSPQDACAQLAAAGVTAAAAAAAQQAFDKLGSLSSQGLFVPFAKLRPLERMLQAVQCWFGLPGDVPVGANAVVLYVQRSRPLDREGIGILKAWMCAVLHVTAHLEPIQIGRYPRYLHRCDLQWLA